MRTCTVKTVYEEILRERGWDPDTVTVSDQEKAKIANALNEAVEDGSEAEFWPELMLTEQRQYRADWDTDRLYAADDEVYAEDSDGDGAYYVSQLDGNTGHDPTTDDGTYWAAVGDDFLATIDFQQSGETEIGAVDLAECIFERDPRIYRRGGLIRDVIQEGDSIQVNADSVPMRPWLRFRPPAREFSLTAWAEATAYAIGDLVYYASTGHTYKALTASTGKNPASETTDWEPVEFPRFLKRYAVLAVHVDYLLDPVERGKAQNRAETELEKLRDRLIEQVEQRQAEFVR